MTSPRLPAVHSPVAATARAIERPLMRCLEWLAAALVAADIAILLIGVIARYAFRSPLIWTDDLAQAVFLWLGMIGATVALNRGEHMRMTALIVRARAGTATRPGSVRGGGRPAVPGRGHPARHRIRAGGGPDRNARPRRLQGLADDATALRLCPDDHRRRHQAVPRLPDRALRSLLIGLAAATAVVAPMAEPWLESLGNLNLILFFVGLVGATVLAGVPIAIAFAVGTFAYMVLTTDVPMLLFVGRFYEGMSHLILLAVPLFVFLGLLIEMTGMARAMVDFLASLLGHVRGGLSYVLVGAMYLVSGISGSKAADMAAVAPALFPEMIKRGAEPGDLVALLSATGAQTETVPPSLVLITIGSVTGVSIGALFTGGLLPSLVLAVGLCVVVRRRYRNQDMSGIRRATHGPGGARLRHRAAGAGAAVRHSLHGGGGCRDRDRGVHHRHRLHDRRRAADLPPVQLVADGADAGGDRVAVRRHPADPRRRDLDGMGADAVGLLAATRAAMAGLPGGKFTFLAVSIVAFVVLGSVLEGIPVIVLFGPLLFPIAEKLGIHEVHYAMVTVLAMGIGLFAPPFGVGFYAAGAIGRIDPNLGIRPIMAYLLAMLIGLVVVAAVPWVSIGFL